MLKPLLIVAGVVVVLGVAAWVIFFSQVMSLQAESVSVTGTEGIVDEAAVRAVVDREVDMPLARLDTTALQHSIEDVPGVRSARVLRSWPSGLRIAVEARTPVAVIPEDAGFALMDIDGVRVGRVDAPPENLPVVTIPADAADVQHTLVAALGVLGALPPEWLTQLQDVHATTPDTVQFTLRDGTTVTWGSAEEMPLKLKVLDVLRAQNLGYTSYDVSAPRAPVAK